VYEIYILPHSWEEIECEVMRISRKDVKINLRIDSISGVTSLNILYDHDSFDRMMGVLQRHFSFHIPSMPEPVSQSLTCEYYTKILNFLYAIPFDDSTKIISQFEYLMVVLMQIDVSHFN